VQITVIPRSYSSINHANQITCPTRDEAKMPSMRKELRVINTMALDLPAKVVASAKSLLSSAISAVVSPI
jgi:hypothetical protein